MNSPRADPDGEERRAQDVARMAAALRESLPGHVYAGDFGIPSKIPFKLASVREPLLFRIADLSEAAIYLWRSGHAVGLAILARAVMEATALLYVLNALVDDVAERRRQAADVDLKLMQMLLGSKNKATPVAATNVMTEIDRMDKRFAGLRRWYDNLSEIAHPNYAGVLAAYGKVDYEKYIMQLGKRDWPSKAALPALSACLRIATHYRAHIDAKMAEFVTACNEWTEGAGA